MGTLPRSLALTRPSYAAATKPPLACFARAGEAGLSRFNIQRTDCRDAGEAVQQAGIARIDAAQRVSGDA